MKKLTCSIATLTIAISASAALLSDFEFNDPSGTTLPNAANSVSGAGQWNLDKGNTFADGNGNMVFGDQSNFYPIATFTSPGNSGGVVRLSTTFTSSEIKNDKGEITFQLRGGTTLMGYIQLRDDSGSEVKLVFHGIDAWDGGDAVIEPSTNRMTSPLTAWGDFDLDNDKVTFYYTYQGTTHTMNTVTNLPDVAPDRLKGVWQYMESGGNSVSVDSVKVETVPEPASITMAAFFAGFILFIRRRFMI